MYERIAALEDGIDTLINCAGVLRQWNAKKDTFKREPSFFLWWEE